MVREEDSLAKAPRREEREGERRGERGFDGMKSMKKMDRMGKREGMRFIVLIPLSNGRVAAALCCDLLFCCNVAWLRRFVKEQIGGDLRGCTGWTGYWEEGRWLSRRRGRPAEDGRVRGVAPRPSGRGWSSRGPGEVGGAWEDRCGPCRWRGKVIPWDVSWQRSRISFGVEGGA